MRINRRIRVSPVRLIGPEGEQIGILPTKEALERAEQLGLDLVEVSPNSRPPVCRIMDFGKYKYEVAKKDRQAKKRQHSFQLKEMRFRPKIDDHDFEFKTKHVRNFLESGSKVKVFVMFRGREMAYQEYGRVVLDRVIEELKDVGSVESTPKMEGRNMNMLMAPRPEVMKKLKQRQEQKAREKDAAQPEGETVPDVEEDDDVDIDDVDFDDVDDENETEDSNA